VQDTAVLTISKGTVIFKFQAIISL